MFDDFRRDYPQIQGARELFLDWKGTDLKSLQVQWRDMQQRTHRRISRKIEVGEMNARRLLRDTVRERAMATDFRCINANCALAQLWPERLLELPTYDRNIDGFVCPSCGQKLEALGLRMATTQFVVYFDGEEQLRVLLEDRASVVVGREDRKGCVGLSRSLSADLVQAVSQGFRFPGPVVEAVEVAGHGHTRSVPSVSAWKSTPGEMMKSENRDGATP